MITEHDLKHFLALPVEYMSAEGVCRVCGRLHAIAT